MFPLSLELTFLAGKILAGGMLADKALTRVHTILNEADGPDIIRDVFPILLMCKMVVYREDTPNKTRNL
jgi:hypothetical protein